MESSGLCYLKFKEHPVRRRRQRPRSPTCEDRIILDNAAKHCGGMPRVLPKHGVEVVDFVDGFALAVSDNPLESTARRVDIFDHRFDG